MQKATRRDWLVTARIISEALPYMQRYDGKTVVIKMGGHAMGDDAAMARFARDVVLLRQCGVRPVVVHGGGPQINDMLKRLGIESRFTEGLRVTTADMVEVVEMVLAGAINKRIVAAINAEGGRAVGLSGKDADLLVCERATRRVRDPENRVEKVLDLGFVGEPVEVNPRVIEALIESGLIPVIAPVGVGRDRRETYNVNGDTAAGAIAGAMKAARLMLLTDVQGVKDATGEVIARLSAADAARLIEGGVIAGGMIPKVRTVLRAMEQGIEGAVILDGRTPHGLLLELFTRHGAGTLFEH